MALGEYLRRWLENAAKEKVQPKTWDRYEQLVRLHLKPVVGGIMLPKLRAYDVECCYKAMARNGASPRTVQISGVVLHAALKDAVRLGMVPFNAASGIARPRPAKVEMRAWDREQALRFLDAAKEERLYALYVLALDTGMRQGELLGLQWPDVDFDGGFLQVCRSLEDRGGRLRLKEPKTRRSRRRVSLSRFTLDALLAHRKAMLAEGNARGHVFCDTQGGWLRKSNVVRRSFLPAIARANAKEEADSLREGREPRPLPKIRFHDLRHTCATLLLLADENVKVVSERLGHASVTLTLDTYSHVLPEMQRRAADKMDAILGRAASK
jgi:integrase